jgi:EthD domain
MITLIRRKEGLTREQFLHHWQVVHKPIFCAPPIMQHLIHYTQNHVAQRFPAAPAPDTDWDGILEVWFTSMDKLADIQREPHYLEHVRPDELKFVDDARSVTFFVDEHPL